ncbi:MAG TPA: hypothetical protein VGL73_05325 [Caulobacteraceae bacterium]
MADDISDHRSGQVIPFPPRPGSFPCDSCHKSFMTGWLRLEHGVVVGGTCQACASPTNLVER